MTIENTNLNQESKEKVEGVFEQTKNFSPEEIQELVNKLVADIEQKSKDLSTTSSSEKSEINNLDGDINEVQKRTEPIDEKIKNFKLEKEGEINQILKEQTPQSSNPETKKEIPQLEFSGFKELPQQISNFKDGKLISGSGRQRFTYNPDTGEMLPSKEGLSLASVTPNFLKESFNFDSKFNFDTPVDQLQLKPAIIDSSGLLIQKGEIIVSDSVESDTEKVISKNDLEMKPVENTIEKGDIGIPYKEFAKKFSYFDEGSKTSFAESSSKEENMFSFDSESGEVLPLRDGWEYAKTNASFIINPVFIMTTNWDTPFDQLRFKPAQIDKSGRIIKKGEINKA